MSRVITLVNHKGGVGKTTSAINIGAGLNALGKKVLLIDLDPQGNLSQSLGITEPQRGIYGAIMGRYPLEPVEILKGLDAIPSTLDLSGAEVELTGAPGREHTLKKLIEPLRQEYGFIIVDCPPALGLLTINALTACQEVIIPSQAEYLAIKGLTRLLEVIEMAKEKLNPELRLTGVFITQYDRRKVLNRDILGALQGHFKGKLFNTRIRDNIALAEAPTRGLDIFRYSPKSYGAQDYLSLCQEIIKRR